MKFGKTSFNVDSFKGKTEKQLRERLSGLPSATVDEFIDYMSKEGFVKKSKKKVEDKEGGE